MHGRWRGCWFIRVTLLPITQDDASIVLSSALFGTHRPYYSYSTCGAMDTFAPLELLAEDIIGNNLVVAITESKPWTFQGEVDPQKPQWKGWKGVLVDLVDDMV